MAVPALPAMATPGRHMAAMCRQKFRPRPPARAEAAARAASTVRAVIGDQLRIPIMWCEMGSCISWHADPAALGEADNRARAINAGWRIDALGRLACPRCQQTDAGFWATAPVVPWDRYTAIARAAAVSRDGAAAAGASSRDVGRGPAVAAAAVAVPAARAGRAFRGGPVPAGPGRQWGPAGLGPYRCPFCLCRETDRTAMAAVPSHPAGGAGGRWLMRAAQMAGLACRCWRSSPDPALKGWGCVPAIAAGALSAEAGSVRAARGFTLATLRRWDTAHSSQDIAVVVSELVTNALRHALPAVGDTGPRGPVRLGLLQHGRWLLCAVADPGKATPVPRTPGALAEDGRGLQMVYALSDQWGYTAPSDEGKIVWAVFAARPTPLFSPAR